MGASEKQLRVNFSQREIEIHGDAEFIREWFERLEPTVRPENRSHLPGKAMPILLNASESSETDDESFGEYLQSFPRDVTDVDRALIAGLFLQQRDADKVFSTGAVSELLRQQGFKLSNASVSIKRNLKAGRVFIQTKGKFRVSQAGVDYLERVRQGNVAGK